MLLIMLTSSEPIKAGRNPSTQNPSMKVETNQNNVALITKINSPSVKIVIGNVKIIKTGRAIRLSKPRTMATTMAVYTLVTSISGTI